MLLNGKHALILPYKHSYPLSCIAIINTIYTAVILASIIQMAKVVFDTLVPPLKKHKAIKLTTALSKVCSHFGYGFTAPSISEFQNLYYLPSNPNLDDTTAFGFIQTTRGTQQGIPNSGDYGYRCDEMFELAKKLTYSKIAIIGNTVHLRPENDPFWLQQSTWNLPDTLLENKEWNEKFAHEIVLGFLLPFPVFVLGSLLPFPVSLLGSLLPFPVSLL